MAAPLIVVNTYPIKEGKLEGLRQFIRELFEVVEANEPRALAINAYVNEAGTEATIRQVHPDAASLQRYWLVLHQHTRRALGQFVDATTSFQVYGTPSDVILRRARQYAESGVAMSVKPEHLGGLTRLAATAARSSNDPTPPDDPHPPVLTIAQVVPRTDATLITGFM